MFARWLWLQTVAATAPNILWIMADDLGCVGVVVDAKSDAVGFYERLGFCALAHTKGGLGDRPEPLAMFLELGAIPRPPAG